MSSARLLKSGWLCEETSPLSLLAFLSGRRSRRHRSFLLYGCTRDAPALLTYGPRSASGKKEGEYDLSTLTSVHVCDRRLFLTIGSKVLVPNHGVGVIKYWGYHHLYRKEIVGVELDVPSPRASLSSPTPTPPRIGSPSSSPSAAASAATGVGMGGESSTPSSYESAFPTLLEDDNHRYFSCKPGHGVILAPQSIRPIDQVTLEPLDLESTKEFAFEAAFSKGSSEKTHIFTADSFEAMQGWVFALSKAAFQSAPLSAWERVLAVGEEDSPTPPARSRSPGDMVQYPWFHASLTRSDIECLLSQCSLRTGLFCVRPSATHPDKLVISVCANNSIEHYLIIASPNDLSGTSKLDISIGPSRVVVKDFKDLIRLLRKPRPELEWNTPLTSYVTYDKSIGLQSARAVTLDDGEDEEKHSSDRSTTV